MQTPHVLLLCVLAAALMPGVSCNNAIGPDDCCFTFYPRRLNKNSVRSYYITDYRCPKAAAVLVTKNQSRHICADLNLSWVENIMKSLDENTF